MQRNKKNMQAINLHEREGPKTFLRFNDPARYPTANSGTVG